MNLRILDLTADRIDLVDQATRLLYDAFLGRSRDWQDLASARQEALDSLTEGKISRVAVDDSDRVLGWIGAMSEYDGNVWEINPLVVDASIWRRGVGRALVVDLEQAVGQRGGLTLWAGSDDENHETTLSEVDLYSDVGGAIRGIRNLGGHPYEFYLRVGFTIVGVMPDANGPGKPDIFLAKRVQRHAVGNTDSRRAFR